MGLTEFLWLGAIIWVLSAPWVGSFLIKKRWPKLATWKRWLVCLIIWPLPFADGIYYSLSFYANCALYSGFQPYKAISTNSLTIESYYNPIIVLEHPAISTVLFLQNRETELGPEDLWISRSKDANFCSAEFTALLSQGDKPLHEVTYKLVARHARKAIDQGYCFSNKALPSRPSYKVQNFELETIKNYSVVAPWEFRQRTYSLVEMNANNTITRFVELSTKLGGYLSRLLPFPQPAGTCPSFSDSLKSETFPYGQRKYEFIDSVILKD